VFTEVQSRLNCRSALWQRTIDLTTAPLRRRLRRRACSAAAESPNHKKAGGTFAPPAPFVTRAEDYSAAVSSVSRAFSFQSVR
jgi:hypothetical protein